MCTCNTPVVDGKVLTLQKQIATASTVEVLKDLVKKLSIVLTNADAVTLSAILAVQLETEEGSGSEGE